MLDDQEGPFGFIVFCLVIGVFLIVIPWRALWEANFLLSYSPLLKSVALNNYVRGAVSGLGAVDVAFGIAALGRLLRPVKDAEAIPVNSSTTEPSAGDHTDQRANQPE